MTIKHATCINHEVTLTSPDNPDFRMVAYHRNLYFGKLRDETAAKLLGATLRTRVQQERASNVKVRAIGSWTLRYSNFPLDDGSTAVRFTTDQLIHFGPFLQVIHKVTSQKVIASVKFQPEDLHEYVRQFKLE